MHTFEHKRRDFFSFPFCLLEPSPALRLQYKEHGQDIEAEKYFSLGSRNIERENNCLNTINWRL